MLQMFSLWYAETVAIIAIIEFGQIIAKEFRFICFSEAELGCRDDRQ